MSLRRAAPVVLAAAVVSACGILGPSGPNLSLRLEVRPDAAAAPSEVGMAVEVGGRPFALDRPGTLDVHAPGTGEKDVVVELWGPSGTLLRHAFTHDFRAGSDHWIHALVGGARPLGHCIGRLTALALPDAAPDTVFILDGSLPEDAVC